MALEHTTRGVPYPDGDEPNNVPLYLQLLAEWVDGNTIDDVPDPGINWGTLGGKPSTFPPSTHNHDDRYYTESEVNDALATRDTAIALKAPKANPSFIGTVTLGGADTDVTKERGVELEIHARSQNLTYTGGLLTGIAELAGGTTMKTTTLTWSSGLVTTITEVVGPTTVTTTLTYDGSGALTGSSRSVT